MPQQPLFPPEALRHPALSAACRALPVPSGHYDEAGAGNGQLRDAWARFFRQIEAGTANGEGFESLDAHAAAVARQVRENGVTYNVYADSGGARPWALDLFPFLISEDDWQQIEAGVAQRATLLDAIASDVYGAQTVLSRGLLPPGLVFGNPGYLRPLKGYRPPGGNFLHLVGIDLAHTAEGGWTVMGHRTESPSGMGYALENRLIVSSVFAEAFREMRVKRLPPSFTQWILMLSQAIASTTGGTDNLTADVPMSKNVVLLTPGPYSETYFEHTFLARHLGINLVEGKDLTVRNEVLYLKTLAGLERVDVVLRRLDDVFCDPVELRPDSALGVPGLLQAMRAGNVLVSNAPGSGFLESPAIHGFMPAISEALLGEPLRLPGVPSCWCGEDAAREQAFDTLGEAFILPTYPRGPASVAGSAGLGMEQGLQRVSAWRDRIERQPAQYTLQTHVPLSFTPRWQSPDIGARAAMVRVYAIADGMGGWHVMPGSFTRLAGAGQQGVSMQFGGSSVDTWVLSSQPVQPVPAPSLNVAAPGRRALAVSSRAAENLFWAGRYSERAENTVRLCRLVLGSIESNDETDDGMLEIIGELTRACGLVPPEAPTPQASLRLFERNLVSGLAEESGWAGVGHSLGCHVSAALEIRNRLSNDHWRTILAARNDFADAMVAARSGGPESASYDRTRVLSGLERLSMQLAAISGAQGDRMTRDEAWRLLFIGRHIERLYTLSTFLEVFTRHRSVLQRNGVDLLLHLFDSTLTYRSLYPGRTDMPALIDQLVIEPSNPRGLYGVLARLRTKLDQIPHPAAHNGMVRLPLQEFLPETWAMPSWDALCDPGPEQDYATLMTMCDHIQILMARLSDEVSARYFSHAGGALDLRLSGTAGTPGVAA